MLDEIASEAAGRNSLGDIHLAAACLGAFAGFLRYDEVLSIWPCDIKFEPIIYIPKSKNDQLRQGDEVVIARIRSITCPISMLEQYMCMAKIPANIVSYF